VLCQWPDAPPLATVPVVGMVLAAGRPNEDGRLAEGVECVLQFGVGRRVHVHYGQPVEVAAPEANGSVGESRLGSEF
jgi:hypothetical protein